MIGMFVGQSSFQLLIPASFALVAAQELNELPCEGGADGIRRSDVEVDCLARVRVRVKSFGLLLPLAEVVDRILAGKSQLRQAVGQITCNAEIGDEELQIYDVLRREIGHRC